MTNWRQHFFMRLAVLFVVCSIPLLVAAQDSVTVLAGAELWSSYLEIEQGVVRTKLERTPGPALRLDRRGGPTSNRGRARSSRANWRQSDQPPVLAASIVITAR